MATLEGIAAAVQQLQSAVQKLESRATANETEALGKWQKLDNYHVAASSNQSAIESTSEALKLLTITQQSDIQSLKQQVADVQTQLVKSIGDTASDVMSLQVETAQLKNETATKDEVKGTNYHFNSQLAEIRMKAESELTILKNTIQRAEADIKRLADSGVAGTAVV